MPQTQRPVTISIRAKAGQCDMNDDAADRLGRSHSDFLFEAACRQSEDVPLSQTCLTLDANRYAALQGLLDKPAEPTDRLRRTLEDVAPWQATPTTDPASGHGAKCRCCRFWRRSRWPAVIIGPTWTVASPRWTIG